MGAGSGALERTRTSDPQLRKLMLYPLSYERERKKSVPGSNGASLVRTELITPTRLAGDG